MWIRSLTKREHKDYTEGSIIKSILKMGLPSMLGFIVQHIYSLVDMYWVSRLPASNPAEQEAGVAAVTFFGNILWFAFSFNQLVGPGSVAIISRRYGEKDYDAAEKAIKETILLKLFFGGLLGFAGFFMIQPLLELVGASERSLSLGIQYGSVMFIGLPIMFAAYSVFTGMRSVANPRIAMGLMIGSSLLNLTLDPLFIFGWAGLPEWGIVGAAYASVCSYTITFFIGLLFFRSKMVNVRLKLFSGERVAVRSMWKIVKIGVPSWLGDMSFSGSRLLITPLIASYGTAVIAAYGVGLQVASFGFMLLVGIGLGLSALIGHNLGSDKIERARKTGDQSVLLGIGVMSIFGVLVFSFAPLIMEAFFTSSETIMQGVTLLRILAVGFPTVGAFIMMEEVHMGVGLNTPTMIVSMIHSWGFQVLPIFMLTQVLHFDQNAVWWVFAVSSMISASGFYLYYRKGKWLHVKV